MSTLTRYSSSMHMDVLLLYLLLLLLTRERRLKLTWITWITRRKPGLLHGSHGGSHGGSGPSGWIALNEPSIWKHGLHPLVMLAEVIEFFVHEYWDHL